MVRSLQTERMTFNPKARSRKRATGVTQTNFLDEQKTGYAFEVEYQYHRVLPHRLPMCKELLWLQTFGEPVPGSHTSPGYRGNKSISQDKRPAKSRKQEVAISRDGGKIGHRLAQNRNGIPATEIYR